MDDPDRPGLPRPPLAKAVAPVLIFVLFLWSLRTTQSLLGIDASGLGIRPHDPDRVWTVLTAPLIHGSFRHLFANTLPLLILGTMLVYGYPRTRWWVVALIWLGSGLGVWLTGRPAVHYGASGVTHGLMFFLFVAGLIRRDRLAVVIAMVAFFLYGGMVWTIFPTEPNVSFESHFWGAVAGVIAAAIFHRLDPTLPRKRYSWEREPEDAEDPVIGDLWKGSADERED